jgi:hypothetical protein
MFIPEGIVSLAKGRRGGPSFTAALKGIYDCRRDYVSKTFSLNPFVDAFDHDAKLDHCSARG